MKTYACGSGISKFIRYTWQKKCDSFWFESGARTNKRTNEPFLYHISWMLIFLCMTESCNCSRDDFKLGHKWFVCLVFCSANGNCSCRFVINCDEWDRWRGVRGSFRCGCGIGFCIMKRSVWWASMLRQLTLAIFLTYIPLTNRAHCTENKRFRSEWLNSASVE